ncbi:hypothetical protein [Streptomyces sp. NPDC018833]|uniref:hypothetical protein n=1 Tax=Streptomyces sp. NPDC018833 TaxID=3365053 RepID=UPI00378E2E17
MTATAVRRARQWFWALTVIAVGASGVLYQGLHAPSGPSAAILVLAGGGVLAAAVVQAGRILAVLTGPPRLQRRPPGPRHRPSKEG